MSSAFDQAFQFTVGHEGGLSLDPKDRGNWTSGVIGRGLLRGTKLGISAMSFPTLDIASLTLDDARAIYLRLYWTVVLCDRMPGPLALLVFDASVNNGNRNAARFLQRALRVADDGLLGQRTMAALATALGNGSPERTDALCAEFQAQRLVFMASLGTWKTYGLGWARRLCALPFQAMRLDAPLANDNSAPQRAAA